MNNLEKCLMKLLRNAKCHKRKYEHLTIEHLLQYWKRQDRRCYYSGIPMEVGMNKEWQVSLERLDPSGTYNKENCALVCLEFNGVKQMSIEKVNFVKEYTDSFDIPVTLTQEEETSLKRRISYYPDLKYSWLVAQLNEQKGRCFYSNIRMNFLKRSEWMLSIERLDESIGHVASNCVLICHEFNTGHTQWSKEKIKHLRSIDPIPIKKA